MDLTQFSHMSQERAATVTRHTKELQEATSSLLAEAKKLRLTCVHCKEIGELGTWSFVQDHYYISPSGCTEGDYWNTSRTNLCFVACPACNKMNYIYNHPEREPLMTVLETPGISKEGLFTRLYKKHDKEISAA